MPVWQGNKAYSHSSTQKKKSPTTSNKRVSQTFFTSIPSAMTAADGSSCGKESAYALVGYSCCQPTQKPRSTSYRYQCVELFRCEMQQKLLYLTPGEPEEEFCVLLSRLLGRSRAWLLVIFGDVHLVTRDSLLGISSASAIHTPSASTASEEPSKKCYNTHCYDLTKLNSHEVVKDIPNAVVGTVEFNVKAQ